MKKVMILLTLLFLNTTVAISQKQNDDSIFKYFFKPSASFRVSKVKIATAYKKQKDKPAICSA
jgi:hypothetical protein